MLFIIDHSVLITPIVHYLALMFVLKFLFGPFFFVVETMSPKAQVCCVVVISLGIQSLLLQIPTWELALHLIWVHFLHLHCQVLTFHIYTSNCEDFQDKWTGQTFAITVLLLLTANLLKQVQMNKWKECCKIPLFKVEPRVFRAVFSFSFSWSKSFCCEEGHVRTLVEGLCAPSTGMF